MRKVFLLVFMAVMLTVVIQEIALAAEANFSASSLTAKDVDCKKCHTDIPHIIHASKPVTCENCHGDKLSVSIPQCTKCHDGPIHKVHAGKIEKGCTYCHKTVPQIHTNLLSDAVCSHCHKDLIEVHGENQSCVKCHKSAPDIIKPLKAEGMTLICQDCHPATSIATIHGDVNNKQGCYNCHKGASKINGSEVPHIIHEDKASCKDCHEENGKVVVPQCPKCHKIDELHAFNKIGKLTTQSGLICSVCHSEIAKANKTDKTKITTEIEIVNQTEKGEGSNKIPGFDIFSGISGIILAILASYMIRGRDQ